jgi:hypothetical protein
MFSEQYHEIKKFVRLEGEKMFSYECNLQSIMKIINNTNYQLKRDEELDLIYTIARKHQIANKPNKISLWKNYETDFLKLLDHNNIFIRILPKTMIIEKNGERFFPLRNAEGTSKEPKFKQLSWIELAELVCSQLSGICNNIQCTNNATLGAHMYSSYGTYEQHSEVTVIVPLCEKCNKISIADDINIRMDSPYVCFNRQELTKNIYWELCKALEEENKIFDQ